ncbi:hypothetical protein V1514DRAFT_280822 [Lipomyces japonicus]|uniref:uncharacterized protein n=1 Tax=Lipomyces japonicus TaxID=56871 RepID=UPI0034CE6628
MSTDPALDLLSNAFGASLTLNNPNATATLESKFPTLTPEQESQQAEVLKLSETFPESAKELNELLAQDKKFLLGTDKPSVADLIVYARAREPIVASWDVNIQKENANIVRWAERVQKSGLLKPDNGAKFVKSLLDEGNKKKKEKGPKPQPKKEAVVITPALVDLRVGFIQKAVKHPDADALYVSTIDVGDETGPRTVCSGLVKYVPIEDMQQRYVIVVANLKPVTMRGIRSEAMVLCASNTETVEFTIPPEGSKPGDKVFFEGFDGTPEPVLNPKKKIFETVQPNFTTADDLSVIYKTPEGEIRKLVNKEGKIIKSKSITAARVS